MGATFARIKTWITGEVLTASDLNDEFDNIVDNLDPDGIDDASTDAAAMRGQTDPYPSSTESLPTDLTGELQRLRYVIAQITGETYWYQDPDNSLLATGNPQFASIRLTQGSYYGGISMGGTLTANRSLTINAITDAVLMTGDSGATKAYFYQNTAPTGWTIDSTPADALLAVKGGSQAYNATGGTQAGTWTQTNHTHTLVHTHSTPNHDHVLDNFGTQECYSTVENGLFDSSTQKFVSIDQVGGGLTLYKAKASITGSGSGTSGAASSTTTSSSATASTWRPLAQVGIIATLD